MKLFKKKNNKLDLWAKFKEKTPNFDQVEYFFKNAAQKNAFQIISDRIMNDMDFKELFMFIDRTHSKIGQQYYYNQLLNIPKGTNFETQEKRIDFLIKNEGNRCKIQSLLSKLDTSNDYYISRLFIDEYIRKPKWFWLVRSLSLTAFAALLFALFFNKIFFVLLLFVCLFNTFIHFWNINNIMAYMDSIPRLPLLCKVAGELIKLDVVRENNESIPSSIRSIDALKSKIRFFRVESGAKSDIESLVMLMWTIIKILFLVEPLVIFDVIKKLESRKKDIQVLFEYIGEVDSAISIATIRNEIPYSCKPQIIDEPGILEFTDMYHPIISNCISNSLQINGKSILLTGSNMSGKTTFVRTVMLNLLIAQTINTAFSKSVRFSRTRLFSSIHIADDLFSDKSYYFEEVLVVKDMINKCRSDSNNIFFLDEIFKGTNTIERIAAGKAILSYLAKSNKNIVFVSTHDIELADLLLDSYDLYHFTEVVKDDQIYFDYKLKQGNLASKNAIRILEINDYPEEVVSEARKISDILKNVHESKA